MYVKFLDSKAAKSKISFIWYINKRFDKYAGSINLITSESKFVIAFYSVRIEQFKGVFSSWEKESNICF